MNDDSLRALIRLFAPARALRKSIENERERSEEFNGIAPSIGNSVAHNANALIKRAATITGDEFFDSLLYDRSAMSEGDADDSQVFAYTILALTQLIAYIEDQVGISTTQNNAPEVVDNRVDQRTTIGNLELNSNLEKRLFGVLERVLGKEVVEDALTTDDDAEEEE